MADDTVSIRMRLTGGKAVATEAKTATAAMRGVGTGAAAGATQSMRATSGISRAVGRLRAGWESIKRVAKVGAVAAAAGIALLVAQVKSAVTNTLALSGTVQGLHRNLELSHKSASAWAVVSGARGLDATALNMSFKTLGTQMLNAKRGSDTAKQAFGDVGISMGEVRRQGGDASKMIFLLSKHLGGADGSLKRTAAASKLLGKGYQDLLPLLGGGAKALKEQLGWSEKYHVAQNLHIKDTSGLAAAQRESKAAWQGIQTAMAAEVIPEITKAHGLFQRFAHTITNPKLSRAEKLHIIGKKIKEGFTIAFDWVVNVGLPEFASRVGQAAPKVAAAFVGGFMKANVWGKALMGAWLVNKLIGPSIRLMAAEAVAARAKIIVLAVATKIAAGAQVLWNLAMSANPIFLVVAALVLLVAGFVIAYKKIGWFRDGVDAVWGALKAAFGWVKSNWKLLVLPLAPILAPIILIVTKWKWVKNALGNVWNWIKGAAKKLGAGVKWAAEHGFLGPIPFIISHWKGLLGFVKSLPGKFTAALSGLWNGIKTGFEGAIHWVVDKINALIGVFNKLPGRDITPIGGFDTSPPAGPRGPVGGPGAGAGSGAAGGAAGAGGGGRSAGPSGPRGRLLRRGDHPAGRTSAAAGRLGRRGPTQVTIPLSLDGKIVAQRTVQLQEDEEARR